VGILLAIARATNPQEPGYVPERGEQAAWGIVGRILASLWFPSAALLALGGIAVYGGLAHGFFRAAPAGQPGANLVGGVTTLWRLVTIAGVALMVVPIVRLRGYFRQHALAKESDAVIGDHLAHNGEIDLRIFGDQRTAVANTYIERHGDLDLILSEEHLRFRRREIKQAADRLWAEVDAAADKQADLPLPLADALVEALCSSLDLPYPASVTEQFGAFYVSLMDTYSLFETLKLPSQLPVVISQRLAVSETDWPLIPRLCREVDPGCQGLGVMLEWSEDPVSPETKARMREWLSSKYAFDLVLLDRRMLRSLVTHKQPQKTFRHVVLQTVNLATVSPFVPTGSTPQEMFFGREKELREIAEHIATTNFAVIGGRRIGKTSLLGRLSQSRLPAAGIEAEYHDCSAISTIAQAHEIVLAGLVDPVTRLDAAELSASLPAPGLQSRARVLFLDEADKLIPIDRSAGWSFFNYLRALSNSGRAHVVLSGEHRLREALREPTGPLFNFATEMVLGPLDYDAVEVLITRPMRQLEIHLEDEIAIVRRIYGFTSGHPSVVQRLCRRLIERLSQADTRTLTVEDVDAVIADPAFQRDDFLSTFWENASPLERILSLLMADDDTIRTMGAVREALANRCAIRPRMREIDDALQRLVDLRSILRRTPLGYQFAVEAFPAVVAGTITLNDMLEILIEEYAEQPE